MSEHKRDQETNAGDSTAINDGSDGAPAVAIATDATDAQIGSESGDVSAVSDGGDLKADASEPVSHHEEDAAARKDPSFGDVIDEKIEASLGEDASEPVGRSRAAVVVRLVDRSPVWVQRGLTLAVILLLGYGAYGVGRWVERGTEHHHVPTGAAETDEAHSEIEDEVEEPSASTEYVCPMHPQIRQDHMGDCPICFMALVAIDSSAGDSGLPVVRMSETARALAGVRTEPARRDAARSGLEVFGRVMVDESSRSEIAAWIAGRVERLYVDTTGARVRRGQRLVRIYSPDLLVAQQTLLHAHAMRERALESGQASRVQTADAAYRAAHSSLRLLGIQEDQIDAIVASGVASETIDIRSTGAGTVIERRVTEGDYVMVGSPLLSVANLDRVWVQVEVFERDLSRLAVGQTVRIRAEGARGRVLEGTIAFIDPVLDRSRRVATARVEVENRDGVLMPDMYVEAVIDTTDGVADTRPPIMVPASAVLWTGSRSLVYVMDAMENPPIFDPVEVVLGPRVGDRYVIESGLWDGEQVVVSGAFRIDATLQIRGGRSLMNRPHVTDAELGFATDEDDSSDHEGGHHD